MIHHSWCCAPKLCEHRACPLAGLSKVLLCVSCVLCLMLNLPVNLRLTAQVKKLFIPLRGSVLAVALWLIINILCPFLQC